MTGPNASETPAKLSLKPSPGMGKGLMKGPVPIAEERLVFFCEDLSYTLKQISSVIKDDDYSDLVIMLRRPCGRQASLAWHRYVYPSLSRPIVVLL